MAEPIDLPIAFVDGQIRSLRIADLMLDEVLGCIADHIEFENRKGRRPDSAVLQRLCLELMAHPSIQRRFRKLEAALGRYWLDPLASIDWGPSVRSADVSLPMKIQRDATGRVAGPMIQNESTVGRARIALESETVLVPSVSGIDFEATACEDYVAGIWVAGKRGTAFGRIGLALAGEDQT